MPRKPPRIYRPASLRDLYRFYLQHFFGEKMTDPRGVNIKFHRNNFPYLIQLENSGRSVTAREVLPRIESGEVNFQDFDSYDKERAQRLHWIKEVIAAPDEIYVNMHDAIKADYVYIKRYEKKGAPYRVFFAKQLQNSVVPVTSFPVQVKYIARFKKGKLLWKRTGEPHKKE